MYKAVWIKHILNFKTPGSTSRGILKTKPSWIIKIYNHNNPNIFGLGECSIIPNLSIDDKLDFEKHLTKFLAEADINNPLLDQFPSIRFALETALIDLKNNGRRLLFDTDFTKSKTGIPINGLIWMGSIDFMKTQIKQKLDAGFNCLKLKIGALNINEELELLRQIRKDFSPETLEIRVDANGAFHPKKALAILNKLNKYKLHSIEQPIKQRQWNEMKELCKLTPIPIALDEELIGIMKENTMDDLLSYINPQYIILKPGLIGGFQISDRWIELADNKNIKWWITSALESNIGLNAIAQWTSSKNTNMPQGLGTGQLFTNNIPSPLEIKKDKLYYSSNKKWKTEALGI